MISARLKRKGSCTDCRGLDTHLLLPNFVFIVIVKQITYCDRKHRRFLYVDVSASDVFAPEAVRKENRRGAFLFACQRGRFY